MRGWASPSRVLHFRRQLRNSGTCRWVPCDLSVFGTVVNGQVLYEEGKYTGALPGKVLRNSHYEQNRRSNA